MALDDNTGMAGNSVSVWGLIIFFILLFAIFRGWGNFGGFNNQPFPPNNGVGNVADIMALVGAEHGCGQVTNCELEKRSLLNTDAVTSAIQSSTNQLATQSRLQYDTAMGEKMFDLKINNLAQQNRYETAAALQQQNYEAKLAAKDATIERMTLAQNMTTQFTALQREIEGIKANMLTKPNITGVGAVCPNAGIVNGLGIGSSIGGYCCGAGSIA